jgi:hypothetical protein
VLEVRELIAEVSARLHAGEIGKSQRCVDERNRSRTGLCGLRGGRCGGNGSDLAGLLWLHLLCT